MDRNIGVIFNGEIYNHLELRKELDRKGHRFTTDHSDTEVLIHGYRQWGYDLPVRLNGMFAFAIYDRLKNRLFLARDRFGEKPLYYTQRRGLFAFSSELTSLAQHRMVDRNLDTRSLQKFFAYGYLPAPHAMLSGARKLPGGYWLSYDVVSGKLAMRSYWRFSLDPDDSLSDAEEPRLVEECAALLAEAARRRLMSDVPLGIFLSGGLDSSSVLASLTKFLPGEYLSAFTIGFTEPSFDESLQARVVAQHLGTMHFEQLLDLDLARGLIPRVLACMDEPPGDASLLPTYLLSAFAREKVAVALTGDGGDELFAGYDPLLALAPANMYSGLVPGWLHKRVRRLADFLPVSYANMSFDFKLRRMLLGLSYAPNLRLPVWMAPLDPKGIRAAFDEPLRVEDIYEEAIALWDGASDKPIVDRGLEFFTQFYLQDDILMKSDRAAMMCSLETRAVFLDNDLVEFCRRLPNRFKLHRGERKYLLKKVARSLLPASTVNRKKKGFGIPLTKWLREVPHAPLLADIKGMKKEFTHQALSEHRRGKSDHRLFLWSWLSAQAFVETIGAIRGTLKDLSYAKPPDGAIKNKI